MLANGLFRVLIILVVVVGNHSFLARGGQLPTVAELLQRHNIQLTQPALVVALRNPDPEVRYLAAQKLVEDKAVETIPLIVNALASEKVPLTRMNIAFALAWFGEETGFAALEDICRSEDFGTDAKVQSAEYLLRLKRQSKVCLNPVLDSLQSGNNGNKIVAVSILPKFHDLSPEDSERVFIGLLKAVRDSSPSVRLETGQSLVTLGDVRAVSKLQEAIAAESDQVVRGRLEEDLRRLEETIHRQAE